jgi:two-component system sensor histidine kinase DegS
VTAVREDLDELAAELATVEEALGEARVIRRHMARNPEHFSAQEREAVFERADQLAVRWGELSARLAGGREPAADTLEEALRAERRRLARDIHDGPAQTLSNLVLETEILERLLERDPARLAVELSEFKATVRAAVEDMRRYLADLGPAALEKEGLAPALRRLTAEWEAAAGTACQLKISGEDRELPPAIEQALYWIVTEALNNVRRHAGAQRVAVDVDIRGDSAGIRIRDDGRGFDVSAAGPPGDAPRLGLIGMRERALAVGGTLEVRSRPGSGTFVEAELPVTP